LKTRDFLRIASGSPTQTRVVSHAPLESSRGSSDSDDTVGANEEEPLDLESDELEEIADRMFEAAVPVGVEEGVEEDTPVAFEAGGAFDAAAAASAGAK
jgi:hypothetical protein